MSAHDEGKAEAAKAVLEHWKVLAQKAREANMAPLVEQCEAQIALLEQPKPAEA